MKMEICSDLKVVAAGEALVEHVDVLVEQSLKAKMAQLAQEIAARREPEADVSEVAKRAQDGTPGCIPACSTVILLLNGSLHVE
jgi:hypothetical protein